jgi:hypothetical protein
VDDHVATVLGAHRVKLLTRAAEPRWLAPGDRLDVRALAAPRPFASRFGE